MNTASRCPACGTIQPTPTVWPPAPLGEPPPVLKTVRLLTGKVWLDFMLGFLAGAGVLALGPALIAGAGMLPPGPALTGVIAALSIPLSFVGYLILYFVMQKAYPIFGRGVGSVFLTLLAALLGAFAICVAGVSGWHL